MANQGGRGLAIALDEDRCLNLEQILESYSNPIKQQHAWAIIYQAVKSLLHLLTTYTAELTSPADRNAADDVSAGGGGGGDGDDQKEDAIPAQRGELPTGGEVGEGGGSSEGVRKRLTTNLYMMSELNEIYITRDGDIHTKSYTREGDNRSPLTNENKCIGELGFLLYSALDYNMDEDSEVSLSKDLKNLLEKMMFVGENEDGSEEDEGICEAEEDAEAGTVLITDLSHTIIALCKHHLAAEEEAHTHYRAVCRALVAEVLDLNLFMKRVSVRGGNQELQDELRTLALEDWAGLWGSVMHQLRNGVKLKKVEYSRTPSEFEMTPYEMLMDDIRSQRYRLNHVELSATTKRDARDVILEFIRSRPPLKKMEERPVVVRTSRSVPVRDLLLHQILAGPRLKPVSKRQLKPRCIEVSPGELLMQDIRGFNSRKSLRHIETPRAVRPNFKETSRTSFLDEDGVRSGAPMGARGSRSVKRMIAPDESIINDLLDFDKEEESFNASQDGVSPGQGDSSSRSPSPPPPTMSAANRRMTYHHQTNKAEDFGINNNNLTKLRAGDSIDGQRTGRKVGVVQSSKPETRGNSRAMPASGSNPRSAFGHGGPSWRKSISVMQTPARGILDTSSNSSMSRNSQDTRRNSRGAPSAAASSRRPSRESAAATAVRKESAGSPVRLRQNSGVSRAANRTDNSLPIRAPLEAASTSSSKMTNGHGHDTQTPNKNNKYRDWIRSLHGLDVNLEEVSHIRTQLSKAEIEDRNLTADARNDLEKGKVCFHCEKVRFGIFTWSYLCNICTRYVCYKCLTKIRLPSDKLREVPVSALTAQLTTGKSGESAPAETIRDDNSLPRSPASLAGVAWNRQSLRASPSASVASLSQSQRNLASRGSSSNLFQKPVERPKLVRSKTMGKAEEEQVRSMKLSTIPHIVCLDCKDILLGIIRAKKQAERLEKRKSRFLTNLVE